MATNDTSNRLVFGTGAKDLAALAIGTSTTETSWSTNGLTIGSATPIAAAPGILRVNDQGQTPMYWDFGRPFKLTAWGTITTTDSETAALKLYQVPASILTTLASGSVASCNAMGASTARTIGTTTASFLFEAKLQWNSTSSLLHGQFSVEINNLLNVYAATTAVTTATALDTELNFILSLTMGTGSAGNTATLREFAIENI